MNPYLGIDDALNTGLRLRVLSTRSGTKIARLEQPLHDRWVPEYESNGLLVVSALQGLSHEYNGHMPASTPLILRTCLDDLVEHNNEIIGVEKENTVRLTLVLPNQEPILYVEKPSLGEAYESLAAIQLEKIFHRGMKLLYEDSRDLD